MLVFPLEEGEKICYNKYVCIHFNSLEEIMTINEIKELLNATVLCCYDQLSKEVHTACGSDMMSDVLAFNKDQAVLITGLNNPQVVRTAEMMDIICICFVRGKRPDESLIKLAEDRGIVLMTSDEKMFESCGILYEKGLRGGMHCDR